MVTRNEIALIEGGPTPVPSYDLAEIVGIRALVNEIEGLTHEERAELIDLLQATTAEERSEPLDTSLIEPVEVNGDPPTGHSSSQLTPAARLSIVRARLALRS
jgi:hypothetical protein